MELQEITDRAAWDGFVNASPYGHPLQLWGWGEAKGDSWTAHRLALTEGGNWRAVAEVLMWRIPKLGRYIAYVPRGPVAESGSAAATKLLVELVSWAKAQGALYLRVEPAWKQATFGQGWVKSRHHLQMNETYTIDLRKSEDEMLEPMSRKHRQYIRWTTRHGVSVERETAGDLEAMYEIYEQTAKRAGFGIHGREYYQRLFQELGESNQLYYGVVEGKRVAFLWNAAAGETVYELYGGMDDAAGKNHVNYLLKWHAFTAGKEAGYEVYDFNGRVTAGVSTFKAGFGPDETDYVGTYDYPFNKVGYHLWEHLWPVAKPIGRQVMRVMRGGRG